jgi:hypothetical protein
MSDVPRRNGRPPIDNDDDDSVPICVRVKPKQYDDLYARAQRDRVSIPERVRRDLKAAKDRSS